MGVRDSDSFLCAFQIPADSTLQLLVPGNVLHRVFSEGSQSLPSRTHTQRAEHNFTLGRPRHLPRDLFLPPPPPGDKEGVAISPARPRPNFWIPFLYFTGDSDASQSLVVSRS